MTPLLLDRMDMCQSPRLDDLLALPWVAPAGNPSSSGLPSLGWADLLSQAPSLQIPLLLPK